MSCTSARVLAAAKGVERLLFDDSFGDAPDAVIAAHQSVYVPPIGPQHGSAMEIIEMDEIAFHPGRVAVEGDPWVDTEVFDDVRRGADRFDIAEDALWSDFDRSEELQQGLATLLAVGSPVLAPQFVHAVLGENRSPILGPPIVDPAGVPVEGVEDAAFILERANP